MEITFYGHACIKVSSRASILMDPWFSYHGAFFGSWFQFPENTPLFDEALQGVNDICISHNHGDHFDPPTLVAAFTRNPSLTVHIPRYQTNWFAWRASRLLPGFADRIIEHAPYEEFHVGGLRTFFVPEESPSEIDSAIIAYSEQGTLVNLNDARLSSDQLLRIRDTLEHIDYLCLQGSGASEYPINYTYPAEEMISRSLTKREDKLEHCKKIIDLLQPKRVLFFAGPPVFLAEDLDRFNDQSETSVFPDQLDIVREIERTRSDITDKTLFLVPGETFIDTRLWRNIDLESQRLYPYVHKERYIADYREQRKDACAFDWGNYPDDNILLGYFRKMAQLSPYISRCIGGELAFVIRARNGESAFTVDFSEGSAREGIIGDPLYILTVPASCMTAVLQERATWDDIFLSLRAQFDERTERFVPHYKTLLRYLDCNLFDKVERYETRLENNEDVEMVEVTLGNETFLIQRFCPHAGTDLKTNGRVNPDGTITCLAHRLCFDLATGECINGRGYCLKVKAQRGLRHLSG